MANGFTVGAAGVGAAGNIIGGLISNAVGASTSKKLMKMQAALNYHYAKKSALNSPTWSRTGLENAGYNPMLAVQNATSGANSSWTSSSGVSQPDFGNLGTDAIANAQSFQRLKNETDIAESQTDANYANADKAKAEKQSLLEHIPWISKREKAEIGNIEKDSLKKEAEIHNIDETTRFIEKNYELQKMLGIRGQDKALYGQIYNADSLAETMRGKVDMRFPFGIGGSRYYTPEERDFEFYNRSKEVRDKYKNKYR